MDKIPDSSTHKPKKRGRSLSSSDIRLIGQRLPDASSHPLPDVNSSQQPQQEDLVFPAIPRGGVTATSDHFVSFFVDNMSDHLQTRKVVQEIERIKKGNEQGSDDNQSINQSINLLGTSSSRNTETPAQSVPASDKTPILASQLEQTLAHDTTINNDDSGYYSNTTIHAVQNEILTQENELLKAENSRLHAKEYLIDAQHSQQAAQMALETAQTDVEWVLLAQDGGIWDRDTWLEMQEKEENYQKRALNAKKEILEQKKKAGNFWAEAERSQSQTWRPLRDTWRSIENSYGQTDQIWEQVVKHRSDNLLACANALSQRAETQHTGGNALNQNTETQQASGIVLTQPDASNDNVRSNQEQNQQKKEQSGWSAKRMTHYVKKKLGWKEKGKLPSLEDASANAASPNQASSGTNQQQPKKNTPKQDKTAGVKSKLPVLETVAASNISKTVDTTPPNQEQQSVSDLLPKNTTSDKPSSQTSLESTETIKPRLNKAQGLQRLEKNGVGFLKTKEGLAWFQEHGDQCLGSPDGEQWLSENGIEF